MKKTAIGLIGKKTICTCSTRFCTFFAVVLHDYNVKLLETCWLPIIWRKYCTCTCAMFFLFVFHVAHFYSGGSKHFSFSHRRNKLSCCSSNKKCFLCFFSLALALSLVELRWPVAQFLFFSVFLFLYIPNLWA